MSDSDELNLEEGGEAADGEKGAAPKKLGGLKALLPTILKFAAIGLGAVIFIVTVAVITVNIVNKGGRSQTSVTDPTNAYVGKRPTFAWYTSIGSITTRTRDTNFSVVVEMLIGYDEGNAGAAAEINSRQYELRDFVRRYFSNKSAAELQPENEARLKNEIRELLNTQLLDTAKARIITFNRFDVTEM